MKHIQGNSIVSIREASANGAILLVGIPQNSPNFLKYHTIKVYKRDSNVLSMIAHWLIQCPLEELTGVEFYRLVEKYS